MAEPVTGLVDTAFLKRLDSAEIMNALGVSVVLLSGMFWVFNFLGIGTQTEVARTHGSADRSGMRGILGAALALAAGFGVALIVITLPAFDMLAGAMGTTGAARESAGTYLSIRIFGAPAVLVTAVTFGALRGLHEMKVPLGIAVFTNAINLALDPLLIFGAGPVPALGLTGAAIASVVAQWCGAAVALWVLARRVGLPSSIDRGRMLGLIRIGGDLFVRTGSLMLFLLLAGRSAARIGDDAGAAHHAIRQVWFLTALILDSYASAAQSLVGSFVGQGRVDLARRVARVAAMWGLVTGGVITALLLVGEGAFVALLVPGAGAAVVFGPAWIASAVAQPVNALSFVTDGVHWGTGDYRYLRNVMLLATGTMGAVVLAIDVTRPGALTRIWIVTAVWITIRATFGMLRVWPGLGRSPLGLRS